MGASLKDQVFELLEVLDKQLDGGPRSTLLKLWARDAVQSGGGLDEVSVRLEEALVTGRLYTPERLSWSHRVGIDRFGVYADIEVESVPFKMRWIPPGRFLMGSPEGEVGREDYEGPQREVELTIGFWLCEVPCTQALWIAVVGENLSYFKDPLDHPAEQVCFFDALRFTFVLNEKIPGLDANLPTEAQWEYACRAGNQEARYGELKAVAWYDENSNRPHPVGQKAPNRFGLYDMLGNINEWCADGMRDYARGSVIDPVGPQDEEEGEERVIRGGAFGNHGYEVRAAWRDRRARGNRDYSVGFRFSAMPGGSCGFPK